ncbi:hypothetical protein BDY24DRAFT_415205 [Mrakia frigida]|uniref:uncharacterized protein n=1 Tax=Mrakia frigida TaxID=29902 RepID=UPI003FCC1E3D
MSPPLRVPLEVLERILSFAFTPLSSPSSSSPITSKDLLAPPLETSHLLLVSKGVRQPALPLYHSIVSIVQGEDWKTFLDPENGLLVGEDNEERVSFVKELWINIDDDACIPIDSELLRSSLQDGQQPDRILVELEGGSGTLPFLDRLLLYVVGSGYPQRRSNEVNHSGRHFVDLERIWCDEVGQLLADEFWEEGRGFELQQSGEDPWGAEWGSYLDAGIQRLFRETEMPSPEDLEAQAWSEREDALDLFVDPDLPPRRVEITLDGLGETLLLQLDSSGLLSTSDLPFVVLPPAGINLETKEDAGTVAASFREDLDHLSFAQKRSLMFEDFPQSFWELIKIGPEIVWGEGWTWRSEDGTVVGLEETFGRSEVRFTFLPFARHPPQAPRHHLPATHNFVCLSSTRITRPTTSS